MVAGQSYEKVSIGIIIQARLGSTRLPSKVLKSLPYNSKISVLQHIIRRAKRVKGINHVIVATTEEERDDDLVSYLNNNKEEIQIFRGSEDNVLQRYYQAAKQFNIQQIIRLTGDNPCMDSSSIEHAIQSHLDQDADYTYTLGYPLGMNVEIIKFSALETAVKEGITDLDKEHVTYFVRNNPSRFKLNFLNIQVSEHLAKLRMTMDTREDYIMLCTLFEFLYEKNPYFGIKEIETLSIQQPYIFMINGSIHQKKGYNTLKEELKAAQNLLQLQDMPQAAKVIQTRIEDEN